MLKDWKNVHNTLNTSTYIFFGKKFANQLNQYFKIQLIF